MMWQAMIYADEQVNDDDPVDTTFHLASIQIIDPSFRLDRQIHDVCSVSAINHDFDRR